MRKFNIKGGDGVMAQIKKSFADDIPGLSSTKPEIKKSDSNKIFTQEYLFQQHDQIARLRYEQQAEKLLNLYKKPYTSETSLFQSLADIPTKMRKEEKIENKMSKDPWNETFDWDYFNEGTDKKMVIEEKKINSEQKPYHEVDAINYSSLYAISIGPQYYKSRNDDKEQKEHFIIGSLVDCFLTEPELFKNKYAVEELEEFTNFPRPQMKKYVEVFAETGDSGKAFEAVGFKKGNLLDVIEEFNKTGKEYADYLTNKAKFINDNKDKTIISKEQYDKAKAISNSLQNSQFTKKYFQKPSENIEVISQLEIYWHMYRNNFKCKLDRVIVDHKNKTIQPIDIKTTGKHVSNFNDSFFGFRYDIQASLYNQGLCDFVYRKDSKYYGYSILPFLFIVESTKYIGTPLIYSVEPNVLMASENGISGHTGVYYQGWRELLERLLWHKSNNAWDYTREQYENEGVVDIHL